MSTRDQLNLYLRGLESRLRLLTWSRGAAIACGVALGATIALVLITNAYAFSAWTGACSGESSDTCTLAMTQAHTVGATFAITQKTLTVKGAGAADVLAGGSVSGLGVSCADAAGPCTKSYDYGTVVTLTATPTAGYTFTGWSTDCTGTGNCVVAMTAARTDPWPMNEPTFSDIGSAASRFRNGPSGAAEAPSGPPITNAPVGFTCQTVFGVIQPSGSAWRA